MKRPLIIAVCLVPVVAIAALTFFLVSGNTKKSAASSPATAGLPASAIYACGQQQQSDGTTMIVCIVKSGGCKLIGFSSATFRPIASRAIPAKNCK